MSVNTPEHLIKARFTGNELDFARRRHLGNLEGPNFVSPMKHCGSITVRLSPSSTLDRTNVLKFSPLFKMDQY